MECIYCHEVLSDNGHATRHAGECQVMNAGRDENVMSERTVIGDGKYEIIYRETNGDFWAFRNGELWRNLVGDQLVLAMFQEIKKSRSLLSDAMKALEPIANEVAGKEIRGSYVSARDREAVDVYARIKSEIGGE